ncbi:hypothetical protein MTO96_006145 [Rhipicephalus appendiculatus]
MYNLQVNRTQGARQIALRQLFGKKIKNAQVQLRYKARHHHTGGLFFTMNSLHYLQPCLILRRGLKTKEKNGKNTPPNIRTLQQNTTYVHKLPNPPHGHLVYLLATLQRRPEKTPSVTLKIRFPKDSESSFTRKF